MITTIALIATGIAALTLGLPLVVGGYLGLALVALAAAALAATSLVLADDARWSRPLAAVPGLAFGVQGILAGLVAFGLPEPVWALIAVAAAVTAWDLGHFQRRINAVPAPVHKAIDRAQQPVPQGSSESPPSGGGSPIARGLHPRAGAVEALTLAHLQRLGLSLGLGLALGGLSLVVRLTYDLRTFALLTIATLVGLAAATGFIRRRSD